MNHRKLFIYIAGAFFFAMCGSLWNEFVASDKSVNPNIRDSVNPSFRGSKARYYAVARPAVESFAFDPNEADSTQLLRLGLTPAQVRSIYRHRAKGYVYSRVEDFARTPFMTKGQWNHLKPLIKIGDQYRLLNANDNVNDNENANSRKDTLHSSLSTLHSRKDSIFHSSFFIINLNDASFKSLVRHPFLSYDQVKAVKNFQRKYGRIRNMTELLVLPEFSVEDTLRLSPYLQF